MMLVNFCFYMQGFLGEFQLSKGIVVEVPHRVLTMFSLHKLAFAKMID